jgi:hypothetical protein
VRLVLGLAISRGVLVEGRGVGGLLDQLALVQSGLVVEEGFERLVGLEVVTLGDCLVDDAEDVVAEGELLLGHRAEAAYAGPRLGLQDRLHDGFGGRFGDITDQPVGVVVVEHHEVAGLVEGQLGHPLVTLDRVAPGQRPAAVLTAPGVPGDDARVDVAGVQVSGDRLAEGARAPRRLARGTADRGPLGALRDVLPLGEDRCGVGHDLLDRGLRGGGHLFGGLAGPDARLDVTGPQHAVHLALHLAGTQGFGTVGTS